MLLDIVLNSLDNPTLIAALLGHGNSGDTFDLKDLRITDLLMDTLMNTLFHHTDDSLQNLLKYLDNNEKSEWHQLRSPRITNLQIILSSLQNHLLADYLLTPRILTEQEEEADFLLEHLRGLLQFATVIFDKISNIVEKHPSALDLLFNILLDSLSGAMLMKILSSLLIMPTSFTRCIFDKLLYLLKPLTKLNKYLPESVQEEDGQPGTETPTLAQLTDQSWEWLIDLERTCALLIGNCLGVILVGAPQLKEEVSCSNWLQNPIFSRGLQDKNTRIDDVYSVAYLAATNDKDALYAAVENLPLEKQSYCKLALNIPRQYDEACAVSDETSFEENHELYEMMLSVESGDIWGLDETEIWLLECVTRCFLICTLKHTGLLNVSTDHSELVEVYKSVLSLRQKVLYSLRSAKYMEDEEKVTDAKKDGEGESCAESGAEDCDLEKIWKECGGQMRLDKLWGKGKHAFAHRILQRSLYILLFVKGKKSY